MAPTSTALTTKVEKGSPYQLSAEQTLKASTALLKHIKSTSSESASKPSLVDEDSSAETPIWLTLTTKTHIISQKTLKPRLISLPNSLNTMPTTTICLITADPQRTYKDLISSPAFPAALSTRITKVVGIDKIRKKWSQYEAQRKLFAEHDIFLADDRIVTQLPASLGKTFYKSTAKRPVPINIAAAAPKKEEKKKGKGEPEGKRGAAPLAQVVKEIEKGIAGAVVHLSPSTNTAVRIGYASWTPAQIAENVEAVVAGLIDVVPQKWRGVRSIYIKGPETAALPIWLAEELWIDEDRVLGEEQVKQIAEANVSKKRKSRGIEASAETEEKAEKKVKKQKLLESNDDKLDKEIAARKEKLKKQKAEAALDADDVAIPVVKASKKTKKGKSAVVA